MQCYKHVRITFQYEDEGHEEVVEGEYVHEELAISVALLPVEVDVVLRIIKLVSSTI